MDHELEKYLQFLNSETGQQEIKESGIVLDKILQCFKQEQSQFTISLLIGTVLEERNALFTFIWKTCSNFEKISLTTSAIKLLDYLITEFPKITECYFTLIFEKCTHLLDTNFAKVKELCLKLIKNLISTDAKITFELSVLILKLEKLLGQDNKLPGTVAEQVYNILGYLFEKYPESVKNKSSWFFSKMCDCLRHEILVSKNPSMSKIKGAFEGVHGYLSYSTPDVNQINQIYEYMKRFSKFRNERKTTNRAALKILQNHWTPFSKLVFNDRDIWKSNLSTWLNQNTEERMCGLQAFQAFYSIIAFFVKKDSSYSGVLTTYLRDCKEILQLKDSNPFEKRTALVGIKLFALTDCLQGEDFTQSYKLIMNFVRAQESSGVIAYLPFSIECISAFILKLYSSDALTLEHLACIQRLSVILINQYPNIEPKFQPIALTALEKSFYILSLCNWQILETYIDRVLYQGIIRTCSYLTTADLEILKESDIVVESISYKSYLTLWKYFLNLTNSPNLPVKGSFQLKKGVAIKVFDTFIESFIKIISKLNLCVDIRQVSLEMEAEIEKPNDLRIFVNCVDLYQDLIPLADGFNLMKWINQIFNVAINLSLGNPLVAGFYKIITTTLKVADTLQFFDGKNSVRIGEFIEQLIIKLDQYKGDLQIVCLQTILAAPVCLIEPFAEKTVSALEVAVFLGRSYYPILSDLIETLERWSFHLPSQSITVIMQKILPHFDIFFQSQYFLGANVVNTSIEGKKLKKKLIFKDSELLTLQKKFLMFLGNLDLNLALNLIKQPETRDEKTINENHLIYHPPFSSNRTDIHLDVILPRVMDLAVSCIDRQTRLIACEFLYSVTIVILGNVNQISGGYLNLFQRVIKTCLVLGSDSDPVVYQIFEPLMFQIVHYFSGKNAMHFTETQALVDILADSVTRPYDPAVRDFSAVLICEFTSWCIKQLTPAELKATPDSIKKILNSIYSLALHPSYNKRLGAAVIFNKVYAVLREEDFILDAYWFQLYYYFVESLRMHDGPENVTETVEALQHVKRPLVERSKDFNEVSKNRIVPPEFEGGLLQDLVKWTYKRCFDRRTNTRRVMMAMVEELAPLIKGCVSLSFFSKTHLQEKSLLFEEKIFDQSNPHDDYYIEWLNYQSALFEYYAWMLNQQIIILQKVSLPNVNSIIQKFFQGVTFKRENSYIVEQSKIESVLLFLKFLDVFKEKAFYLCNEVWDLLKVAVFKPNELGFDLSQSSTTRSLISALTNLLQYFSKKLTQYNWSYFYYDLESYITVPVLRYLTKNRIITINASNFLFSLKVIVDLKIWETFVKKTLFCMNGNVLVEIVFSSLFVKQKKIAYAISLEPSCRWYFEELITIGFKLGIDLLDIYKFLQNSEVIKEEETGKSITKGQFFQSQFKSIIFEILASKSKQLVEKILSEGNIDGLKLLVHILETVPESADKELQHEIINRWSEFEKLELKETTPEVKRKTLIRLAMCTAQTIGKPGCLKNSSASYSVYNILKSEKFDKIDVEEMEGILILLPFLSSYGEKAGENPNLETSLSKFLSDHNHLRYEVSKNTLKTNILELIINGLLKSLKLTGSLVVLRLALTVPGWFENFCKKEEVDLALNVFADLPIDHAFEALNLAYHFCFEDDQTGSSASFVYKWFLNPLLKIAPNAAVYDGIVNNLEKLFKLITKEFSFEEKSLSLIRVDIIRKTCVAGILQTFVAKLTAEEMNKMPKEKKYFMEKVVVKCFPLLRGPQPTLVLKDRYRKFMCEVFNMICSIISSRCTDPKFYKLFLFDERGSFLFVALDLDQHYSLGMDFDVIPRRKKFTTSLRKKITRETQLNFDKTLKSIKYVQTNTLFNSSLREDYSKFDLTHASIRPLDSVKNIPDLVEIELEVDSINSHECMAPLVAVITKMVNDKITPLTMTDEECELPCWLSFFLNVLNNAKFPRNLKLFIVKALYNVQNYVKPFAKNVFPKILDFISNFFANEPLNYLLIDLIEMLIDWRYLPEEESSRLQLTRLVESIIQKSDSLRRDIVKNNIEVIKTMVEIWKKALNVTYLSDFVFLRLMHSTYDDIKNNRSGSEGETYLNIHVCGVLLSNEISPWKEDCHKKFFNLVLKHFTEENRNKQIFAEVCGLGLKHLSKILVEDFVECEELVKDKICSLNCWLPLLCGVHKHYPQMSSKFVYRIFSSAWDSIDPFTTSRLEMLLSFVSRSEDCGDDTFDRHAHSFLIDMLNSSDELVQKLSLQIASKCWEKLEERKANLLLREIFREKKNIHPCVRKLVYEIAMNYYLKEKKDFDLQHQCKTVLLWGLNDSDKELEKVCFKFWKDFFDLTSPLTALIKIFQEMYTPETENIFLSNAAKILIGCAASSHQFEKSVFPHPITHAKFQKRNIILGSRKSILPGFMSGRISTNQSLEYVATLKIKKAPYIRTESSLKFDPTVRELSGETNSDMDIVEELEIPKTPYRRRFYRVAEENNLSFGRWQMKKKKIETEQEEESIRKREIQVDIYGEYRAGDYPDIEISHSQILKPLEALSVRDPQVARQFLVSFFSGLTSSLSDEDKKTLLSETEKCFKRILKTSTSFDTGVFGFVLEVLLNYCRDLEIDCDEISNAVVSSNCLSLGALVMEKIILKKDDAEAPRKRQKGVENSEEQRWLDLAKLYRSLEEYDVVSGILLDKLKIEGDGKSALISEALLDWSKASEHYRSALSVDTQPLESEFYTESYFLCLAKLSNWSYLNECLRNTINQNLDEAWENFNILSWFLKSEMMMSLGSKTKNFQQILEDFTKTKYKSNVLKTNFGEELAVGDWLSGKLQKASCRIDRLCLDFLAGWSHSNRWCCNLRAEKLSGLQTIAELNNAIRTLGESSKSQMEQNLKICEHLWEKNVPSGGDDLRIWDVKLRYRKEFIRQLKEHELDRAAFKSYLVVAKVALGQNNLSLAKECLSDIKENLEGLGADLRAEYDYCMNLGKMVVANLKMNDINEGLTMYLNVWRGISNQIAIAMEADSEISQIHLFRCNFILGQLVSSILPSATKNTSNEVLKIISVRLKSSENVEMMMKTLKNKGLEFFEKARDVAEEMQCHIGLKEDVYVEISKFLLKFSDLSSFPLIEKLTKYLLKAMSLGSSEARQLFGCVLNLLVSIPQGVSLDGIIEESKSVPSWMFLMWINQILANLNSKIFPFLKPIVLRIAQDYPNALRYPFRLSKDRYESEGTEIKAFAQQLTTLLHDNLYDNFLHSMNYLGPPDLILKYHLEKAMKILKEDSPNFAEIKTILKNLYELMFAPNYKLFRGSVFDYWNSFKLPLEKLMVAEESKESLSEKINNLVICMEKRRLPSKRTLGYLESYSSWLCNFHSLKEQTDLELPGQYCGNRKPIKKYLVTISFFRNEVLVFSSKCKPMRITILGNDAAEHKFLVKFGEDLRQDERIQQVFGHFNHILKENKQTRFSIDTYKVIPLSFCLGMIEWVENNVSFHEMIESSLGNDSDLIGKAQVEHLKFLSQGTPLGGSTSEIVTAHLLGYDLIKRNIAVSNFKARMAEFPHELLKRSFWELSASPEHFVYLRANFAISHAVMCLTHWLIGIGDRHLQNTLISTKTGRVLGIDFGYAFGFATQFLTPPELIPFRLTPQILNLISPLKESGWIKQTMISCLRIFRREHFRLLSVLEVFALEPVVDWLDQVKRSQRGQSGNFWHPRQKILMVKEKLNGVNPTCILEEDLKAGHSDSKYLSKYLEVLKGVEQHNVRARIQKEGLTEEEQVDCLIDLATDPHILSKTYIGWNPWL